MPQRTAKQRHWYAGRTREAGETVDVEPGDVPILVAFGHIERQPDDVELPAPGTAAVYETRAMTAAPAAVAAPRRRQTLSHKAA